MVIIACTFRGVISVIDTSYNKTPILTTKLKYQSTPHMCISMGDCNKVLSASLFNYTYNHSASLLNVCFLLEAFYCFKSQ